MLYILIAVVWIVLMLIADGALYVVHCYGIKKGKRAYQTIWGEKETRALCVLIAPVTLAIMLIRGSWYALMLITSGKSSPYRRVLDRVADSAYRRLN